MDRFIPSKKLVSRPNDPVWWTPECTTAISTKRQAWMRSRKQPTCANLQHAYTTSCQRTVHTLDRARASHLISVRNKLSQGSLRDKAWWMNVKRAGGEARTSEIPLIVGPDGCEYTTSKEKADCFGLHFSQKCSLHDRELTPESVPHLPSRSPFSIDRIYFRQANVLRQLKRLDASKASGPDGISCRVLKECATELAMPLSRLFSLCLQSGYQPSSWKTANVVPVHKRDSKAKAQHYRPVSLLSVMSKVMEFIVNSQIINHLERYGLLSPNQFGFRRRIGAADLLTSLHHEWVNAVGSGGTAHVLAIDIAGAFDRVSHLGLLSKARSYGIRGCLLNWLSDYLHKRTLQAVVGGQTSDLYPIRSGVPQGSILGPTLFILYINDAEDNLPDQINMAVYADDTTLYATVRPTDSLPDSYRALQSALEHMEEWGEKWRVSFEPAKSQLMSVSRKHTTPGLPQLSFLNRDVQKESRLKLLGVSFDSKLSYGYHIHRTAIRATQRLHFLRKAAVVLCPRGRAVVYKGFVRPLMEYSPLVWLGAAPTHLNKLDRVQLRALKIIGPTSALQTLHARRTVAAATYMYKLKFSELAPRLRCLLPPPTLPPDTLRTRRQVSRTRRHPHQLTNPLSRDSPNYLKRSFPYSTIDFWNCLPASVFPAEYPTAKHMNTFKGRVNRHITDQPWSWDVV